MVEPSIIATVKELEQFATDSTRLLGYEGLKRNNCIEAIASFLQGNDTFVALDRPLLLALTLYYCHMISIVCNIL